MLDELEAGGVYMGMKHPPSRKKASGPLQEGESPAGKTAAAANRFGHIDLRVNNAQEALAFYSRLMPELGFTLTFHGGAWYVFAAAAELPQAPYFAITEDPQHVPNGNRIAFWAPSPAEVDRIAEIVAEAGGRRVEGPEKQPYSATYYAVYFEDPSGNRFEVYYRKN